MTATHGADSDCGSRLRVDAHGWSPVGRVEAGATPLVKEVAGLRVAAEVEHMQGPFGVDDGFRLQSPVRQPLDAHEAFHDCVPGVRGGGGVVRRAGQPGHPGQQHSRDSPMSHPLNLLISMECPHEDGPAAAMASVQLTV